MAKQEITGKEVAPTGGSAPVPQSENTIQLGAVNQLDLSGLTVAQQQQLKEDYARGMLDVHKKAEELKVDVAALEAGLGTMAHQTAEISKSGDSVTLTHSQSNTLGRTEVVMGNTEKAAAGKLSRSQTGEPDRTMLYIGLAALVIIVAGIVLSNAFN